MIMHAPAIAFRVTLARQKLLASNFDRFRSFAASMASARVAALLGVQPGEEQVPELAATFGKFADFQAKLAGSQDETWKALAIEGSWKFLKEALSACGYEDADFKEFCNDCKSLGMDRFTASVPSAVGPRAKAKLVQLLSILADCQLIPPTPLGASVQQTAGIEASLKSPTDGPSGNMFLGQVVAAAVRQDTKALEQLTDQVDPTDELRKLVLSAGQGEPIKEHEPDEAALRLAKSAAKNKRFLHYETASAEDVTKWQRPLPQLLAQELPKLWAASLSGLCAWGDVMNWIGSITVAASDKAVASPVVAERAAALYGLRLLRDAYSASKRGAIAAEGRENVSKVFSEVDWSLLHRCQQELSHAGQKKIDPGAAQSTEEAAKTVCLRSLLGTCRNYGCHFRHGCPFCRTGEQGAWACFSNHLARNGLQLREVTTGQGSQAKGSRKGDRREPVREWSRSPRGDRAGGARDADMPRRRL